MGSKDTIPTRFLSHFSSLSHKWYLENKGMAWGGDVVVI